MKTESEIQAEVLAALGALHGIQIMRVNSGVFHDADGVRRIRSVDKGTFDILMCVQIGIERKQEVNGSGYNPVTVPFYYNFGQLVWMEIKTPDKKLRPDQLEFGDAWAAAGAICVRITSAENALEFINNIQNYLQGEREKPKCWVML